jgi:RNA polymerase sigma factor (sigma-70 family)
MSRSVIVVSDDPHLFERAKDALLLDDRFVDAGDGRIWPACEPHRSGWAKISAGSICNREAIRGQEKVMDSDRQRFERLFRQNYGAVVRYAVRRVGEGAAGEIVSETFLIAWRRLPEVPENALPWLYGTARRLVANEIRRRRRSFALDQRLSAESLVTADHSDVIDERLRVLAALDSLTERDREVLRLSSWEQLDGADAARVLGCTLAAYKVRLHRARRRLAALLTTSEASLDILIPQGEQA